MNLLSEPFLFIDCQSTGATPRIGNLLELAWCVARANDQSPGDIRGLLVKQPEDKPVPYMVKAVTGITDAEMVNAVDPVLVYETISSQIDGAGGRRAIAHYASFERPFLAHLFETHGNQPAPFDLICTYQIARRLFPNLPTRGIRGLGGFFGASDRELKRAEHHVETTWSIWRGLVVELEKRGIKTLSELEEWLSQPYVMKRGKYEYPLPEEKRLKLPNCPGVYRMLNKRGEVLYVGKATSLKSRVNSYFRGQKGKDPRKLEMATQTHDISIIRCDSAIEAAIYECDEIKKHNPPYNLSLKSSRRSLSFVSKSLCTFNEIQSDQNPIGPFSSSFVMEQFVRTFVWIATGVPDQLIFYGEVSDGLIEQGFSLFCESYSLDVQSIKSARDLMALSIRLLRNQPDSNTTEGLLDAGGDALDEIANLDNLDDDNETLEEYTPELVAAKFGRLFKRAARAYLRAKVLTRLLNCTLNFREGAQARRITFKNGFLTSPENMVAEVLNTPYAWNSHDVSTYDRLSVVLAELVKLQNQRKDFSLDPPIRSIKILKKKIV